MSIEKEMKWMTKKYSWRYIPLRYQAMVAIIVSAFLYYNIFELFFNPTIGSNACGTLLRPILEEGDSKLGWFWDSGITLFTMNESLQCPRTMQVLWWEFYGSFAALAICGLVLRRAIKRQDEAERDAAAKSS